MVVFLLAVVVLVVVEVRLKSNPRNSVFAWKIAFSSSDSSGRFPTSSIRSSGGRSNVEIAFSHGR